MITLQNTIDIATPVAIGSFLGVVLRVCWILYKRRHTESEMGLCENNHAVTLTPKMRKQFMAEGWNICPCGGKLHTWINVEGYTAFANAVIDGLPPITNYPKVIQSVLRPPKEEGN